MVIFYYILWPVVFVDLHIDNNWYYVVRLIITTIIYIIIIMIISFVVFIIIFCTLLHKLLYNKKILKFTVTSLHCLHK